MIIVTGSVTARPDTIEALRRASLDHVARSRTEDGCISHAVHVDCENELRLFFFEQWRDLAALKLHFDQPGSRRFIDSVRSLAAASEAPAVYDAGPVAVAVGK